MEQLVAALQLSLTEVTQEVVNLRATVATNEQAMTALQATANSAWTRQDSRMNILEKEIEEAKRMQGQGNNVKEFHWNLEHKGTLKEYAGDSKAYRPWARRFSAVCNSKVDGFRIAFAWAEKMQTVINDSDLQGTGWGEIMKANTRVFDLLSLVCTGKALRKVETTPGTAQGFEAWRRLARQYMPTSRLTRIDRLNQLTHVEPCSSMKEFLGKIESRDVGASLDEM